MLACEEFLLMVCGKLLGDGCIVKQEGRKPRFQFIHSIKDKEWCYFCYSSLKYYLPLTDPHYKGSEDDRVQAGYTESYFSFMKHFPDAARYFLSKFVSSPQILICLQISFTL
jgi:LAGLIDADG DNA endonuclease family